ncbi:MAG: hypothetical protein QXW00_02950 [Candidatus Woesearchaeota archaeon]
MKKKGLIESEVGLWILAAVVLLILIIIIGMSREKIVEWISKIKTGLRFGV